VFQASSSIDKDAVILFGCNKRLKPIFQLLLKYTSFVLQQQSHHQAQPAEYWF
jgi:hypothetical protein